MLFRLLFSPCVFLVTLFLTTICLTQPGNVSAAVTAAKPIQGKVLETMNAGGYTYLRVQGSKGDVWVAVPATKVTKGQQVVCQPGMTMTNFTSKTLGRTFDSIIFSPGIGNTSQTSMSTPHGDRSAMTAGKKNSFSEAMRAEHAGTTGIPMAGGAAMMGGAMMASGGSNSAIVPSRDIKVDKAEGDNAFTVGECFNQGKKLNNKKVRVRGKVVKVSRMIMGRNWVHIQDGTGNPMDNTHDLVVTTMADPKLDSVVVVEGTLHADKDFGAGYKYKVIIEDAEIK